MRLLTVTLITFFCWGVSHAETKSVDVYSANLRSSPSTTASYVVLQVPKNYPLMVLESTEEFYKVSDFVDRTGWIHKSIVGDSAGVVVVKKIVNLRKGPGIDHEITCKVEKGVAFEVIKEQEDWLEVLHDSGKRGWIYKKLVWGI